MPRIRMALVASGLLLLLAAPARSQVAFGPQIGSIPDGAILPVTPVATFDRRYVRMSLSPQFYGFQGFETATIPAAVGGGGFGFNGGFGGFGGFGGPFVGGFGDGLITGPAGMASPYGPGMYGYGTTLTAPPALNPLANTIRAQVRRRR